MKTIITILIIYIGCLFLFWIYKLCTALNKLRVVNKILTVHYKFQNKDIDSIAEHYHDIVDIFDYCNHTKTFIQICKAKSYGIVKEDGAMYLIINSTDSSNTRQTATALITCKGKIMSNIRTFFNPFGFIKYIFVSSKQIILFFKTQIVEFIVDIFKRML